MFENSFTVAILDVSRVTTSTPFSFTNLKRIHSTQENKTKKKKKKKKKQKNKNNKTKQF